MASFLITYDPNLTDATVSPTTQYTNTSGFLESLATPIPGGDADYTFIAWYTTQVDGDKITTDYEFTENTTIYAHWTEGTENTKYVQYDEAQDLTSNQRRMARENIEAAAKREDYISRFTGEEIDNAVEKVTDLPDNPVTSINGKSGAVILSLSEIQNDKGFVTREEVEEMIESIINSI